MVYLEQTVSPNTRHGKIRSFLGLVTAEQVRDKIWTSKCCGIDGCHERPVPQFIRHTDGIGGGEEGDTENLNRRLMRRNAVAVRSSFAGRS